MLTADEVSKFPALSSSTKKKSENRKYDGGIGLWIPRKIYWVGELGYAVNEILISFRDGPVFWLIYKRCSAFEKMIMPRFFFLFFCLQQNLSFFVYQRDISYYAPKNTDAVFARPLLSDEVRGIDG